MVVVVEMEMGCLLIFLYPSKTCVTCVMGAGLLGYKNANPYLYPYPPVTSTHTGL